MKIKICGLTRHSDVAFAIEQGVDALGLVFDQDRRRIDEARARELLKLIAPSPVESVAVIGRAGADRVRWALDLGFDLVQVVAQPSVARLDQVVPVFFDGEDLIERVSKWPALAAQPSESLAGVINLDSRAGGNSGQRADWQRVARVANQRPVMLAGGLRHDNVAQAIALVHPVAVDVSSGVESAPGEKDHVLMRQFVSAVRAVD